MEIPNQQCFFFITNLCENNKIAIEKVPEKCHNIMTFCRPIDDVQINYTVYRFPYVRFKF